MAVSGLFLVTFLMLHVTINFISVISVDAFNEAAHFMGTNPLIQFVMQPILAIGVIFHFVMGFVLEMKNRAARPIKYAYSKPGESSSWISRNMIISGIVVLLFLGLHFYDFWLPELKIKFVDGIWNIEDRYYTELNHKFVDHVRTLIYTLSFVFLSLHLMHGFQSAFQSIGLKNKDYTPLFRKISMAFAIVVPALFIFIAWYHHLNPSH